MFSAKPNLSNSTPTSIFIIGLATLIGVALLLLSTARYGAGLTPDSIIYLSAAQNLMNGQGYQSFLGRTITEFPPLFSLIIAFASAVSDLSPTAVSRYVNALLYGTIVAYSGVWLAIRLRNQWLIWVGVFLALFAPPAIHVARFTWAEPLFILLTLFALWMLERYWSSGRAVLLMPLALFSILAYLTRYAGLSLILCAGLIILIQHSHPLQVRLRRLLFFSGFVVLPLIAWLYRNRLLTDALTGNRVLSTTSFGESLIRYLSLMSGWLLPSPLPLALRLFGLLIISLTASILVATVYVQRRTIIFKELSFVLPMLLFVVIYSGFLLATVTLTALEPLSERYMTPLYIPLLLIGLSTVDFLITNISVSAVQQSFKKLLLIGFVLWMLFPLARSAFIVTEAIVLGGGGFNTVRWIESDLIEYLREHKLEETMYTNAPYAVFAHTGLVMQDSPRQYYYGSQTETDDLNRFNQAIDAQGIVVLAYFSGDEENGYLYDLNFLQEQYNFEELYLGADGGVYRLNR